MTAFLEIEGLTKRHGGRAALDAVGLAVGEGEFVALVGPSGSGKTTLLKSINRLVDPDGGTIRIGGRDIRDAPAGRLRHGIGYVIQSIGLFPHMSIAENINIVPRLMGSDEDRTAELLGLVALPAELADRYPRSLSGGQQQRVGVARALAARPKLMLMDEPFGALDPVTRDALGGAYRGLHERLGLTTLMVTHDVAEALLLADRVVVLIDGRVRADAAPADLAKSEDPDVKAMIDVPRRQAARLAAL
ncbi:MAG: osmoprotectant transport system ATP-binding protein [Sphingomonadales bacterium]|jgi:osmoprotectant transport system ATP-binding protein|nr:osmoprotectant transport system ATP-binding protein [Sphingomonadales bacterium]